MTNSSTLDWSGGTDPNLGSHEVSVDGAFRVSIPNPTTAAFIYAPPSPVSEGAHSWEVKGIDVLGRYALAAGTFEVDRTPPAARVVYPNGAEQLPAPLA